MTSEDPSPPRRSVFDLTKWYLDCGTPAGLTFIGYFARLRWQALHLTMASALLHHPGRPVETQTSLAPADPPRVDGQRIRWNHQAMEVSATFAAALPAVQRRLLDSPEGFIDWSCLHPLSNADVHFGDHHLAGCGYVERLHMTLSPERLPVQAIRWGRFLAPKTSVVWIDWRGEHPLSLVFHNGAAAQSVSVDDRLVTFDESALTLQSAAPLRAGKLASTALAGIPGIGFLLPRWMVRIDETKWITRAELASPSRLPVSGHAIHELVRFPGEWR